MKTKLLLVPLLTTFMLLLTACGRVATLPANGGLQIVATTSIVADVVRQVGGEYVNVTLLLPLGTDPHTFEPRPQDLTDLADTQIVFANGAGLEEFLQPLIESAGAVDKLVEVSAGIELLGIEEEQHEEEDEHDHEDGDPHTWMDPNNVLIWVDNITTALESTDPEHAAEYHANADAYRAALMNLDAWVRTEVVQIPVNSRVLVSDHAVFGYFAEEYGFTQGGTITGSFSTNAAPSAQELARLEDEIRSSGVRAIFVTEASNRGMADQIGQDTGIQAVWLYHASLTEPGGPAPTYLDFMRYNVTAIVEALK